MQFDGVAHCAVQQAFRVRIKGVSGVLALLSGNTRACPGNPCLHGVPPR